MAGDRTQILDMLKDGKISVSEAERLLDAVEKQLGEAAESQQEMQSGGGKRRPRYLHIRVEPTDKAGGGDHDRVNIRVPLQLLRAGVKLASVIPDSARDRVDSALRDKGVNMRFEDLNGDKLDELVDSLAELAIDVDSDDEKITIFCE